MRFAVVSLAVLLALLSAGCQRSESVDAGDWPQFKGPGGLGVSPSVGLPVTWSEGSANTVWKTGIPGLGNSSPIISGSRVFLTSSEESGGQVERFVLAVDFATGEMLWQTPVGEMTAAEKHQLNTYAAPTPATDGRHVFAFFGDLLACLDLEGRARWVVEVDPEYVEYSQYGAASSPVLTEQAVIVAHDRENGDRPTGRLFAFDKTTGEELWEQSWSDSCCSYTTPVIRRQGSSEEVIFLKGRSVAAFDAKSGEPLWSQPIDISQPVASPLLVEDLLVVFSGAHNIRHGAVMRLAGEGKETEIEILWETNQLIPQTSTPLLYDGRLYSVVKNGTVACFDLSTGTSLWRRRVRGSGGFHASLVAGDGKIYVSSKSGTVNVIDVREGFGLLASNQLEGGVNATPALTGRSILLRTASSLYRIDGSDDPGTPIAETSPRSG